MRLLFILIGIIILMTHPLQGQNNNPFEVRVKRAIKIDPDKSFEPEKIVESIHETPKPTSGETASTAIVPDSIEKEAEMKNEALSLETKSEEILEGLADNPFDIDRRRLVRVDPTTLSKELKEETKVSDPVSSAVETEEKTTVTPVETPLKKDSEKTTTKTFVQDKELPVQGILSFIVLLLSMILMAVVANVRRSIFGKVFKSLLNDNILKATQKDEENGISGAFIILYIIFILNISTFIYLSSLYFFPASNINWWAIFGGVMLIYAVRHLFLSLFSVVFLDNGQSVQYGFMIAVFNLAIGIILFPLNLIIAFAPEYISSFTLIVSIVVLGIIYLVRYARGVIQGLLAFSNSLFHFFLYLCTFEIVPLLMIIRICLDSVNS